MITRRAAWFLLPGICLYAEAQPSYFPPRHQWETRTPEQAGFDPAKLRDAIDFIVTNETKTTRDLKRAHDLTFAREAYGEALGPFQPRGPQTGIVVRDGYLVAEWGEPNRPDMCFSVTKSFLSSTVGVAFDRGLIRDLDDRVVDYLPDRSLFDGETNSRITWDHLLRQTSDWEGTLWGKPDWADRPPKDSSFNDYIARQHAIPGTTWKYNDVRVNLLALVALHVWRRPLPEVLRATVMDPIGASNTWRWLGYDNSWVNIDGIMMQSVSGGGHWGGGMVISARDMGRFGLLTLRGGKWRDKRILSDKWVTLARTPTGPNEGYGFMNWFLNTGKKLLPGTPEAAFCHLENGANVICADPETNIVIVVRWVEQKALDGFVSRLRAALR